MKLKGLEWRNLYSPFSYLPKDFAKIKPREILSRQNSEIIISTSEIKNQQVIGHHCIAGT